MYHGRRAAGVGFVYGTWDGGRVGRAATWKNDFAGGGGFWRRLWLLVAQAEAYVSEIRAESYDYVSWFSVGARHAVPGGRTWRDRAIVASRKLRAMNFEAGCEGDGAGVLMARSGTARRAPTVGKKQRQRSRQDGGMKFSWGRSPL